MAKVFISYHRASKDLVEQLVRDLADDDQETWFDQHLTGGQKWWDNILSQIRECEVFVAALTPDFLKSRACQREIKYAKDLQRTLLPVRLSDRVSPDLLPPDLSELQWVDYSRLDREALKSLQRTIRHLPNARPLPDPLPDAPPVPISDLIILRTKIDTDSQLPRQDQIQLVFELRRQFRNGAPAEEIVDLLQRLKRRDDLIAAVSRDIDDLQREIDGGRSIVNPSRIESPSEPGDDALKLHPSLNSGLYGGLIGGAIAGLLIGVVDYVQFSSSGKSLGIFGFSSVSGVVLGGCIQLIILWFRHLVTEKQYPVAFYEVIGGFLGGAIGGGTVGMFAGRIFGPLPGNFVDPYSLVPGSLFGMIFITLGARFYAYRRRWKKIGLAFMAALLITICATPVGILIFPHLHIEGYFDDVTNYDAMSKGGAILGAVIGIVAGLQVGLTLSVYRLLEVTEQ